MVAADFRNTDQIARRVMWLQYRAADTDRSYELYMRWQDWSFDQPKKAQPELLLSFWQNMTHWKSVYGPKPLHSRA